MTFLRSREVLKSSRSHISARTSASKVRHSIVPPSSNNDTKHIPTTPTRKHWQWRNNFATSNSAIQKLSPPGLTSDVLLKQRPPRDISPNFIASIGWKKENSCHLVLDDVKLPLCNTNSWQRHMGRSSAPVEGNNQSDVAWRDWRH